MSYEKHTWETGETITADKLNNIENGIAKGGLIETIENERGLVLQASYNDVISFVESGILPFIIIEGDIFKLQSFSAVENDYNAYFSSFDSLMTFTSGNASDDNMTAMR